MSDLTEKALRLLLDAESLEDECDEARAVEGAKAVSLLALAESVEALVEAIKARPDERTVDLGPVVSGPALGDPLGYAVAGPVRTLLTNICTAEYAAAQCVQMNSVGAHCRVVAVYDLPTEVQP